jgi:hypothetical protein
MDVESTDMDVAAGVPFVIADRPDAKADVSCFPLPAGRMPDHNAKGASDIFELGRALM